jgi:2-dehydro-3-deoxyphosphooctonate aldolase (KDO 8-P synthase)
MTHPFSFELIPGITFGADRPVLIAGPCAVENYEVVFRTAKYLNELTQKLNFHFVFKSSFDKANRTSYKSFRSVGFTKALGILERVRNEIGVPILTDIHETSQVEDVSQIVDILQIPAFLCRQTDLIQTASRSGLAINIKKGQFMAPDDMGYAVEKVRSTGNNRVFLTERGSSFGYHNLVVDMRSLPIMRKFAPVIFDATHSIQMPGGAGGSSSGQSEFAPYLARSAAAAGVDGFFVETHPDPSSALSDGPNMIPLDEMPKFLESLLAIWQAAQPFIP